MKTKTVRTSVLEYAEKITICIGHYNKYNNLYIGLYDNNNDELYTDITTNIMPLSGLFGYVNKSNAEIVKFIEEQHIGLSTGIEITQGFNTYILYQFTIDDSFTEQ